MAMAGVTVAGEVTITAGTVAGTMAGIIVVTIADITDDTDVAAISRGDVATAG